MGPAGGIGRGTSGAVAFPPIRPPPRGRSHAPVTPFGAVVCLIAFRPGAFPLGGAEAGHRCQKPASMVRQALLHPHTGLSKQAGVKRQGICPWPSPTGRRSPPALPGELGPGGPQPADPRVLIAGGGPSDVGPPARRRAGNARAGRCPLTRGSPRSVRFRGRPGRGRRAAERRPGGGGRSWPRCPGPEGIGRPPRR